MNNCLNCDKSQSHFKEMYLMEKIDGSWLPVVEEWLGVKGFVMLCKNPHKDSVSADHIQDANGFDREGLVRNVLRVCKRNLFNESFSRN